MTQLMTEQETLAAAITRPVRRTKTRGPVAVQKGERGFIFHFESEPQAWTLEFDCAAMSDLAAVASGNALPTAENLPTLPKLRQFGLLVLGDRGDIDEPVTLSDLGYEVKRALEQMSDARPGMTLDLQVAFNHAGKANLTEQMAGLLVFTGRVATAIMHYSAYNSQFRDVADLAPEDLMWLGACLSDFEGLGLAIARNDQNRTLCLCEDLIGKYQGYQVINPIYTRQAKPTFDRQSKLVKLHDAIAVLESIKAAVQNAPE